MDGKLPPWFSEKNPLESQTLNIFYFVSRKRDLAVLLDLSFGCFTKGKDLREIERVPTP